MPVRPPQDNNTPDDGDFRSDGGNGLLAGPIVVWVIGGGAAVIALVFLATLLSAG